MRQHGHAAEASAAGAWKPLCKIDETRAPSAARESATPCRSMTARRGCPGFPFSAWPSPLSRWGEDAMAGPGPDKQDAEAPEAAQASLLEHLYRSHAGWLNRVLAWRLRTTALDVDDIVQETYVRMGRYAPEDAARHPKALLLRIAVNLARDQMRRNVVRGGLAEPLDEEGEASLASVLPEQHEALEMKQAILALPPIYRDVFVLSRFTGLTYEEIASHAGISVKTVEWRMTRALAMCAARLRD